MAFYFLIIKNILKVNKKHNKIKAKIAGIDPGITTGIVVLDEDGEIIFNLSKKNLSDEEIIKILKSIDGLVMISTDKNKVPKKIYEISSKLNLGIFFPKRDIPLFKKKKFYSDEKIKKILKNSHEIDAYISAYLALLDIKDILKKAKNITKNYEEYIEILKKCFKKKNIEPSAALYQLRKKEEKEINKKKKRRKRKENTKGEIIYIKVKNNKEEDSKSNIEKNDEQIKNYIKLLEEYNFLSVLLLERLKKEDNIIPKISFLKRNNIKYKKVFFDIIDDFSLKYISENKPEIFILQKDVEKIPKSSKIYIVREYTDLKNYIIVYKYELFEKKDEINIENIKKIIESYKQTDM